MRPEKQGEKRSFSLNKKVQEVFFCSGRYGELPVEGVGGNEHGELQPRGRLPPPDSYFLTLFSFVIMHNDGRLQLQSH
jgi:hypothetical protein